MKEKKLQEWNKVKTSTHLNGIFHSIEEGDVWWCSIGENVGIEINGKQELFLRPVLVLKKLSKVGFMGIPLTTQPHTGNWYTSFSFDEKKQNAVIAQARVLSVFRLRRKMGTILNKDLERIKHDFQKLYK